MNPTAPLFNALSRLITTENTRTREQIASSIVDEHIGDYENKYQGLQEKFSSVKRIADLASDLEWSNGSEEQLEKMWQEMCDLIKR